MTGIQIEKFSRDVFPTSCHKDLNCNSLVAFGAEIVESHSLITREDPRILVQGLQLPHTVNKMILSTFPVNLDLPCG